MTGDDTDIVCSRYLYGSITWRMQGSVPAAANARGAEDEEDENG